MSSIMKGLVDEQDIEETKKLSAQEKFKRSMKRAGYDMDAGAKRLQDLLDKQKKEREELEKKELKDVSEDATLQFAAEVTPTVNPYAGIKDRKFRGAIGEGIKRMFEEPNYSPTDAGYQEGGWRKLSEEELDENLRKWFKEKWVRFGPDGKIRGACARGSSSEGKPKCLPQAKAHALGKKGRKYAAAKKRREDPNPERSGPAKNVATKKKSNEAANPAQQAAIAINMKKLGKKPKSESINEGLWDWIKDKLSNKKPIQWSENYYDFIIRNDPTYLQTYLNAVKNDPNYIEWKKNNPNKPQQSTSQTNYASSQNRPNQSASFDDFTAPHGSSENELKMFVNGQKPAAIVPEPNFSTWAKVINSGKYWTKQLLYNGRLHSVIIVQPGNEQSGQQIYELVQNAMKLAEKGDFRAYNNSNYHRRLGKLLGYPKDKVEQFINNYFKDREDLAKIKIDEQGVTEGYSDMSGLLSASNLNNSYIITAELAEGGKKKFRVKAQSERVAIEKFKKHHSMAKIIKVEEEGVKEGSKYPRNPASYHLKKYPVPQDQMAKPVKKEPKKPEQKPEEKVDEGKRIPRKPGQPANSKKHSDLYTDENPKGTIHGLKFATAEDATASVSKIRNSGRSHAHKIQAAVAMEQRAKAAGKAEAASVYRKFINSMKKKTDESQIDEACWKGYHKEGMKTMFGKKYPNCVKNKKKTNEGYQQCPECGGAMYEVSLMNEKKDACYYKVKSRYKVWPSAYASGALVKCRKKGASNWGNKSKSNEGQIYSTGGGAGQSYRYFTPKDNLGESSSILSGITQVDEGIKTKLAGAALAAAMGAFGTANAKASQTTGDEFSTPIAGWSTKTDKAGNTTDRYQTGTIDMTATRNARGQPVHSGGTYRVNKTAAVNVDVPYKDGKKGITTTVGRADNPSDLDNIMGVDASAERKKLDPKAFAKFQQNYKVDEGLKSQLAGAALAAAMAAGGAQADNTRRVVPQPDGTMSPSYAQQIANASQNLQVVKPLPNNFEQIVYKGMNGVRDKEDGTIVLIGNAPNSVQVISIENNKETTDYMDIKQLGNETKQALSLIVNKSETQPLGKPTPGVTVDKQKNTLNYNGKEYDIVKIKKNGPQPRISRFDAKVQVPYPDFGIRSLGVVNVTLAGDTAYAYLD